jgi:hypothetical protein
MACEPGFGGKACRSRCLMSESRHSMTPWHCGSAFSLRSAHCSGPWAGPDLHLQIIGSLIGHTSGFYRPTTNIGFDLRIAPGPAEPQFSALFHRLDEKVMDSILNAALDRLECGARP